MFIHDIAKWIMKYDYTSKITAALNARDLREQHDAHLYTPDTLNAGDVHKVADGLKSSPLSLSSRRVINFSERRTQSPRP